MGDLFPHIRKYFKEKSSIPRSLLRGFFIAVNFDEELTGRIVEIQEKLRTATLKGNFSRRENLHLTLVFLGETGADVVPAIRDLIAAIPSPGTFTLNFSRAACFRRSGKELWYMGAAPNSWGMKRLLELRAKLVDGLERLATPMPWSASSRFPPDGGGLSFDRRPFNAHITLGRELRLDRELAPFSLQIEAPIRRISLMQSEHRSGRLVYTELFGWDM